MKNMKEENNEEENNEMDQELELAQALALRSLLNLDSLSADEQLMIVNSVGVKIGIVEDTVIYLNSRGYDLDHTNVSVY